LPAGSSDPADFGDASIIRQSNAIMRLPGVIIHHLLIISIGERNTFRTLRVIGRRAYFVLCDISADAAEMIGPAPRSAENALSMSIAFVFGNFRILAIPAIPGRGDEK